MPTTGDPVDLDALSFPELIGHRVDLMAALVLLCRDDAVKAAEVLGLGPTQACEVERNAALPHAPAAPARDVYAGILYDALDLKRISGPAADRANASIIVTSAVFGAIRPSDHIPAYRLGGSVSLPGIGPIATFWRPVLRDALSASAGGSLVLDLRSTTYAAFWRPPATIAGRVVAARVLHEVDGRRTVVSHHNKATKGHLLRSLLTDDEFPAITTPDDLATALRAHGWTVELTAPQRAGRPWLLDVVVDHVPTS